MNWVNDKNKREVILFYIAIIGAVLGAMWTLLIWWEEKQPDPALRPHLNVHSKIYTNLKSIEIKNSGMGTAVITDAKFCRDQTCTNNIVELFSIPNAQWDTFVNLNKNSTIKNNSKKTLVQLSESERNNTKTLQDFQNQKNGITIDISYTDIEGNAYGPLTTRLK